MKPVFVPAALLLALFSSLPAHAENYAGVSVGRSDQKFNMSSATDESDTALKLVAGHKFNRHFGLEAGFAMHGKSETRWADEKYSTEANSLYLAATATLPLSEQFALTGKLGLASNRVKYNSPYGDDTESHGGPMVGIGASYAFTPTIAGVVEFEQFRKPQRNGGSTNEINSLTVGVRTSF